MIQATKISLFAAILLAAVRAHSAEQRIECPTELPDGAVEVVHPPPGWTASTPGVLRLHSVDLMTSPPSDMEILRADKYQKRAKSSVEKWTGLAKLTTPKGKWLACNYGFGSEVTISKRIDDHTSECTATYTKDAQGGTMIDVHCKR